MPRLSNVRSGAIVSVPEEKVARLGSDWVRIDAVKDTGVEVTDPVAVEAVRDFSGLTVAELQEEIAMLNEERDADDVIVPESAKKADLVAALDAATAAPGDVQ